MIHEDACRRVYMCMCDRDCAGVCGTDYGNLKKNERRVFGHAWRDLTLNEGKRYSEVLEVLDLLNKGDFRTNVKPEPLVQVTERRGRCAAKAAEDHL